MPKKYFSPDKLIVFLICILIISVCLAFDIRLYSIFDLCKVTTLRIITLFIIFILFFTNISLFKIFDSPLKSTVVCYLFWLLITTLFSYNSLLSIFGYSNRYEGILTWLNYFFVFLLTAKFFTTIRRINLLFSSIFLASLITGVYGLIQVSGNDFIFWGEERITRIFSTLGNPVFLGALYILALPLGFALFFSSHRLKLIIVASGIILIFSSLLLTLTRACILGVFAIMSIFLAALIKKYFPILRTSIISLILLGITGSISLLPGRSLTTRFSDEILVSSTLPKECDITAKFKGSAKHRLLIWRDLRRAIQDFSLFGVGLDGMLAIFPHYRSEETISTEGQYCRADRAHNEIFDVATSRGIPGLLIHLLLLNTTFLLLLRKIRRSKGEERNYSIALLAAFFGFFVQNLFSFQMIATATIWWALLGVTYNLTSKDWINKPQPLKWVPRYFPFLILPLFILPILPYIADIHYCNAEKLAAVGNLDLAIQEYRRAATLYPGEYKYYPSLAKSCLDKVIREPNLSKEEKEALLEEAKKVIKRALAVAKEDAIMLNLLGMVYYLEGNLDKAALYYKKALKIEPYLADAHNNLGVVYANLKDYKRAEKEFRKAVEFDKEYMNNLNNLLKLKANKLNSS